MSESKPTDTTALRARAENDEPGAQVLLGAKYLGGRGVPKDAAKAVAWFRKAAENGNRFGQLFLGWSYQDGAGVPQDDTKAATWFRRAAEQGDTDAQTKLGALYGVGRGVPQDYVTAHMWFNLAAARTTGEDHKQAAEFRETIAERMTREQLAEAQRLAREWDEAHPRE